MEPDTNRRQVDPEAYWRRRVYVLVGGLAAVGLVVWACSGSDDQKSTAQVRNAAATASPTPAAPGPMPTATVTVTASPTVTPPAAKRSGDACESRDIVLSVGPDKGAYRRHERPRLRLSVVNTGRLPCTFDVGAVRLRVRSASGTIWSSRCGDGPASSIRMLPRGLPYVQRTTWNRKTCGGIRVQPGTYTVTAKAGRTKARRQSFRLR